MKNRSEDVDTIQHSRRRIPGKVDSRLTYGILPSVSALYLWYSADDLDQADASSVYTIKDRSTNSNNGLYFGTPKFYSNKLNGRPAIYMGINSGFSFTALTPTIGSTYFIVYNKTGAANNDAVLTYSNTEYAYLQYGSTWYVGSNTATVAMTANQFYLKCAVMNGSTIERFTNGSSNGSVGSSYKGIYRYLGYPSNSLLGYVAELVIFNKGLSSVERVIWEDYFRVKYALW